jgi:hypothetical protein
MATPHVAGTAALCIATGHCPGTPANVMSKLRNDAAAEQASYGFTGDPRSPISSGKPSKTLYYGYLISAGGY